MSRVSVKTTTSPESINQFPHIHLSEHYGMMQGHIIPLGINMLFVFSELITAYNSITFRQKKEAHFRII